MTERQVEIKNLLGLHARPAAQLVKIAARFKADVFISLDEHEVNGKSIMGVMMLAAAQGSKITIRTKGEDEEQAIEALVQLIETKFGEE